jgi:heat shock protein HslJ
MSPRHCAGLLLSATALTACFGSQPVSASTTSFQIVSRGQDKGGEFCRNFTLTPAQVERFFSLATVRSAQQLHDDFDHLPCWVRGTGKSRRGSFEWEIRAGGTASIRLADGRVELLGCDKCDTLLTSKAQP